MSEIVIIGPDGNRFVFPAGTDRETMRAAMRRRYTGANARTREMIMTSQLPDPELQGVRDYLGREQLTEDIRAGREAAELEAAAGPENIAKERFYTAAQGQTLGAAPLLQGAVNVPIAAVMYPFLTEEDKAGRDFGQFVSEMSSLGYDQARGNIARAREKRPLESAGIEIGAGFLTGKTIYDELGKRFLASRAGARGAAVGAGAGGQYGFLEGEGDVGQGLQGALVGAPLGAGAGKAIEAVAEPLGRMFKKPLVEQTFPPYEEMIASQAEKTAYQRTPEFQQIEGDINKAFTDISNAEATIAKELRDQGYAWEGEEGDFMNVIDGLRREGRLGNFLAAQVEDLRDASRRLFDSQDRMKAHLQEVASGQPTGPGTAQQGFGNAFAESALGSAGGSVLGSRTDLNGDGVIDEQDVFLGAAGGAVGVPAITAAMRRGGNAFAPQARSMGAGAPKTPQQADAQIEAAYRSLESGTGWVPLRELRRLIQGSTKEETDAALRKLLIDQKIDLTVIEDMASMTDADRAAAARIGAGDKHLIRFVDAPTQTMGLGGGGRKPLPAPQARAMGAGVPETPQQAARFETPGSPEYEAAVAKGLDMSTPARKARAQAAGYNTDEVLYHGTASDVNAFDPQMAGSATKARSARMGTWLTSSPRTAEGYAEAASGTQVQKLIDQSYAAESAGQWDKAAKLMAEAEALEAAGVGGETIMPLYVRGRIKEVDMQGARYDPDDMQLSNIVYEAQAAGFDGVKLRNFSDEAGYGVYRPTDHVVIFDPANIRSVHAAFDPDKAASSTLLAAAPFAVGGAGLGVAANQEDR